jgi:hypothetical protein
METQKRRQVEYHDREHYRAEAPRRPDRSNPIVAWLDTCRLRIMLELMGSPLDGRTVLTVCGGDGEEAGFLAGRGGRVTVVDLSAVAIRAARRRVPAPAAAVADAEALPFPDGSFDWVVVRDGMHHLARPMLGLYEMERVARIGFAVLEGHDSWAVRILVALGFGERWDPAGGFTYRFGRQELEKALCCVQTLVRWRIRTAWLPPGSDVLTHHPAFRRWVYPVINQPAVLRLLTRRWSRAALVGAFRLLQFLAGRWGNGLVLVARKRMDPEAGTPPGSGVDTARGEPV